MMSTVKETRRKNLLALIGDQKGAQALLAREMDVEPAYVSQLASGGSSSRGIGDRTARKIERARGLPRGWMDQAHDSAVAPVALELQLIQMFKALPTAAKLQAVEQVTALYLKQERTPYGAPTVFESDLRERPAPERAKKRAQEK